MKKRTSRLGPTNFDRILAARHAYMKSIGGDLEVFARDLEKLQEKLMKAGKIKFVGYVTRSKESRTVRGGKQSKAKAAPGRGARKVAGEKV